MSKRPGTRPATVRIIGGSHRGRRIPVADVEQLRPTPDRVRETLFNWLAPFIDGARVLDLCAGTGVLGLESLSRGAAECIAVERDPTLARAITELAQRFGLAARLTVRTGDALIELERLSGRFDVVFLDPPYPDAAWHTLADRLAARGLLAPQARVYLEWPADLAAPPLPPHWEPWRESRAGKVGYGLFRPPGQATGEASAASAPPVSADDSN
jgi:16S rRNA (guanine966-N2)-methyltransferase